MKRILLTAALFLALLFATHAQAAESCTGTSSTPSFYSKLTEYTYTIVTAADGSFTEEACDFGNIQGEIRRIVTDPGTTAPTDDWDFVLNDALGADATAGAGADRDEAVSESIVPSNPFAVNDTLTVDVTGNIVDSAEIVIKLYVTKF